MTTFHQYPIKKLERFRTIHSWVWYIILGLIIAGFATVQLRTSLTGPVISFDTHLNLEGYTYAKEHKLKVSGSIERVAYLYIDEELKPTTTEGTFDTDLYVWPGRSTINIRAVDRYGREKNFALKVFDPNSATAPEVANLAEDLVRETSKQPIITENETYTN